MKHINKFSTDKIPEYSSLMDEEQKLHEERQVIQSKINDVKKDIHTVTAQWWSDNLYTFNPFDRNDYKELSEAGKGVYYDPDDMEATQDLIADVIHKFWNRDVVIDNGVAGLIHFDYFSNREGIIEYPTFTILLSSVVTDEQLETLAVFLQKINSVQKAWDEKTFFPIAYEDFSSIKDPLRLFINKYGSFVRNVYTHEELFSGSLIEALTYARNEV